MRQETSGDISALGSRCQSVTDEQGKTNISYGEKTVMNCRANESIEE